MLIAKTVRLDRAETAVIRQAANSIGVAYMDAEPSDPRLLALDGISRAKEQLSHNRLADARTALRDMIAVCIEHTKPEYWASMGLRPAQIEACVDIRAKQLREARRALVIVSLACAASLGTVEIDTIESDTMAALADPDALQIAVAAGAQTQPVPIEPAQP